MNILKGRRSSLFANVDTPLLGEVSDPDVDGIGERSVSFAPTHTLYNLISNKKWEDATVCVFHDNKEASVYYTENNLNMLPLHKACELQPPKGILRVLIESHRDGLKQRDHDGRLPLHTACQYCASEEVILFLIKAAKESARTKDFRSRLPLHIACENGASENVIESLIRAHPGGVEERDEHQRTPLDIVQQNHFYNKDALVRMLNGDPHGVGHNQYFNGVSRSRSNSRDFTPSLAASLSRCSSRGSVGSRSTSRSASRGTSRGYSYSPHRGTLRSVRSEGNTVDSSSQHQSLYTLISQKKWQKAELRCQIRPDEAGTWCEKRKPDGTMSWRLLPLHRACELQPNNTAIITYLIRAAGLTDKDHSGRLPLHSACRKVASADVIATLVASGPHTASYKDSKGRLPLHIACEYGASKDIIKTLVAAYPQGVDEGDHRGHSPRSIVNKAKFHHKAMMLEGLDLKKNANFQEIQLQWERLSAFNGADDDYDGLNNSNSKGSMTERGAILKNLSVSFGNDNDGNALKPTLGYDSQALAREEAAKEIHTALPPQPPVTMASTTSRPIPQSSSSASNRGGGGTEGIWISNCNTTSSLSTDNDDVVGERTLLCNLVTSQKWEEVMEQCDDHPEEAGMWWCKRDRSGKPLWSVLPIHKACELHAPPEVITALIQAYPESVLSADQNGRLPIHLACCRGATANVVNLLLQHGGEASLTYKDSQGRLPLHVACVHGAAERVINMLLNAYPESIDAEDKSGRTAVKIIQLSSHRHKRQIMYLLQKQTKRSSERSVSPSRSVGSMSLVSVMSKKSVGSASNYSMGSNEKLLSSNNSRSSHSSHHSRLHHSTPPSQQQSLELKDSQSTELTATDTTDSTATTGTFNSNNPAHHARHNHNHASMSMPMEMSERQPKLYTLVDKRRWDLVAAKLSKYRDNARVWYIQRGSNGADTFRELTIHRACQLQAPDNIIQSLIAIYAHGTKSKTHQGKLPLHLACEFGCTEQVVNSLIKANPEGVHHKDKSGMLPIHYACDRGCSRDVIKALIRVFPASLDEEDNYHRTPRSIMDQRYFA
eukprot:CAMPEP_0116007568 /NCGR_PEP_ID=MMETSP0321-20121206/2372_1 /TAXON_ID=163516 /ORGANISM="Leptocylindrus danicus var. danicus, Strain B650" /LENGTH=1058 /DNA_ID=CAMNT_0003476279 /DNA_START=100 /DNA_END=3273 /DNA_ORIENTATION=-